MPEKHNVQPAEVLGALIIQVAVAGSLPPPSVLYQYQKAATPLEPVVSLRMKVQPLGTDATVSVLTSSENSPRQISLAGSPDGRFKVTGKGVGVGVAVSVAVGVAVGVGPITVAVGVMVAVGVLVGVGPALVERRRCCCR